jgi:hypothetical protein
MRQGAVGAQRGGARLLVLALVLGVSALFLALHFRADPGSLAQMREALVEAVQPAQQAVLGGAPPADRILECTAPDGSTFYTNARSCDAADLDQRVTELPSDPPEADAGIGQGCLDPAAPHQFLPRCAEAFRGALALEAELAAAADPSRAPEAEEYCALVAQGVQAGCPADSALFCFLRICQQRADRYRAGEE